MDRAKPQALVVAVEPGHCGLTQEALLSKDVGPEAFILNSQPPLCAICKGNIAQHPERFISNISSPPFGMELTGPTGSEKGTADEVLKWFRNLLGALPHVPDGRSRRNAGNKAFHESRLRRGLKGSVQ